MVIDHDFLFRPLEKRLAGAHTASFGAVDRKRQTLAREDLLFVFGSYDRKKIRRDIHKRKPRRDLAFQDHPGRKSQFFQGRGQSHGSADAVTVYPRMRKDLYLFFLIGRKIRKYTFRKLTHGFRHVLYPP